MSQAEADVLMPSPQELQLACRISLQKQWSILLNKFYSFYILNCLYPIIK